MTLANREFILDFTLENEIAVKYEVFEIDRCRFLKVIFSIDFKI